MFVDRFYSFFFVYFSGCVGYRELMNTLEIVSPNGWPWCAMPFAPWTYLNLQTNLLTVSYLSLAIVLLFLLPPYV